MIAMALVCRPALLIANELTTANCTQPIRISLLPASDGLLSSPVRLDADNLFHLGCQSLVYCSLGLC